MHHFRHTLYVWMNPVGVLFGYSPGYLLRVLVDLALPVVRLLNVFVGLVLLR
jgi:hypothetical protein